MKLPMLLITLAVPVFGTLVAQDEGNRITIAPAEREKVVERMTSMVMPRVDFEDTKLAALIASLQKAANGVTDDTEDDGSVDDMSSKAFMKALQDKIDTMKESADTAEMAAKMQEAYDAGTLTVTNAVAGEQITTWDVYESTQTSAETTSVDQSDWSSFLKDVLARDTDNKFVRNADSSYIEKSTGASSYFGMVGDLYYYISWTMPKADAASGQTSNSGMRTKLRFFSSTCGTVRSWVAISSRP